MKSRVIANVLAEYKTTTHQLENDRLWYRINSSEGYIL